MTEIIGERYNNYVNPLSASNSKTKLNNIDTLTSDNILSRTFHNREPSSQFSRSGKNSDKDDEIRKNSFR